MRRNARNAIVTLAVLIVVLGLGTLVAIPAYVSSGIEDDLTRDGGTAHVKVDGGVPPLDLLDDKGESIEVTGSKLKLPIPADKRIALGGVAGYDKVHVDLRNVQSGPFRVARVRIDRERPGTTYAVAVTATAPANQLGDYVFDTWGDDSFVGGLLNRITGDIDTSSPEPVNIRVSAKVDADGRNAYTVEGGREGLNGDAVAQAVASAVIARL